MPEGPEVRVCADKLRPNILHSTLYTVRLGERAKAKGFERLVCPSVVIGVRSHGKKLIIDLNSNQALVFSLGMSGSFRYEIGNHSHVAMDFYEVKTDGVISLLIPKKTVYFDDTRYMGHADVVAYSEFPEYFKEVGPDLLQAALQESTWIPKNTWLTMYKIKRFQNKSIAAILLDQKACSGIGWYLATEIMYFARVHPLRLGSSITDDEWEQIRQHAHRIIKESYSAQGCTIYTFISPDGSKGEYVRSCYGQTHDSFGNPVTNFEVPGIKRTAHVVLALQK